MARCMARSVSRSTTGAELDVVGLSLDAASEDVHLAVAARVAERRAQEEAIELCLGERVRPLVLDRVLRRDDEEGRLEDVCVTPSIVTWRSCIASSSAACVFGGARLISSERRRFVKIGPGRNSKSPSRWFQIDEPVTSEGMRSGVNWMRVKRMLRTCANERAASVFARPG